ncbi:hypothetical protein THAOC_20567 [Thalassiosira oceanica]|uniref:Uncharacterized protein n=1 Tax=Thalassiosira oceanica TaxID=159749 RepID=K0RZL6_THAOC|nr:hypothetical protein THAOC_20567 [Thalassiosira oceanica]|eukprot:EJK59238.1 hypothetical protein THAOC_20567 [Thalassiosira oceanica]
MHVKPVPQCLIADMDDDAEEERKREAYEREERRPRKVDAFPVGRLYFNPSMHDEFTEPVIVSLFARAHTDWGATGWSDPVFSLHFF